MRLRLAEPPGETLGFEAEDKRFELVAGLSGRMRASSSARRAIQMIWASLAGTRTDSELLRRVVPFPELDLVRFVDGERRRAMLVVVDGGGQAPSPADADACGKQREPLAAQRSCCSSVATSARRFAVVGVEHRQERAIDERMHELDGGDQRCAASRVGFSSECFERGVDADLAVAARSLRAIVRTSARRIGKLFDERGDPLRIVGRGVAAAMQASANAAPPGASSFERGPGAACLRAEFADDRDALCVGEVELRELGENRLGEFGPAEVDEPEDGLHVVARLFARHFQRGADGGIRFEHWLGGLGWRRRPCRRADRLGQQRAGLLVGCRLLSGAAKQQRVCSKAASGEVVGSRVHRGCYSVVGEAFAPEWRVGVRLVRGSSSRSWRMLRRRARRRARRTRIRRATGARL